MKTRIPFVFISFFVMAFMASCGPSQADQYATSTHIAADIFTTQTALAPTATATFTPSPTATQTPTSTITPTPTQTPTPTPTKHPLAGDFVDGKLVMPDSAYRQLTDTGQSFFEKGWYLYEVFLYDAMLEYSLQPDQLVHIYNLQSEDYEYLGHYDLAIQDDLKILEIGDRRAGFLNSLCWNYAITNQAELALPYCEEAVKKDPSAQTLDSRGFTYALLGRYPEALSDFEAALEEEGWPSDDMKSQRQEWIAMLKSGNNPITEQVLVQERGEETTLIPETWYTDDMALSFLRTQYEDMGYVFEETVVDGQITLTSTIQDGKCRVEIVFQWDDQIFSGGSKTITGCSHTDMDGHAWDFIATFSRDLNEMAHAIVWHMADVYYVIEGKPVTDLNPTIGSLQFSAERTSVNGEDGILLTAKPAEK